MLMMTDHYDDVLNSDDDDVRDSAFDADYEADCGEDELIISTLITLMLLFFLN